MALLLETARLREVGPDDEFPDPEPDIDPMREFNAEAIYDPADAAVFRRRYAFPTRRSFRPKSGS